MAGSHPGDYEYEYVANVYEDKPAARMWRKTDRVEGFGTLMQMFEADRYLGQRMRFSALVRTKDVADWAGLWMRVDGPGKAPLAFYNMEDRKIVGTTDYYPLRQRLLTPPSQPPPAGGPQAGGGRHSFPALGRFVLEDDDP
jgi:hypothetical protein